MRSKGSRSVALHVPVSRTRREFLHYGGAVVGASILAASWPRGAAAQTTTFDYFISPTGSNSNPGTLASPWALTAINSKQSTYAGKKVGIIGDQGTYECLTIYGGGSYPAGIFPDAMYSIQGGTSASSPTVIASCNSSGVYVARLAVLDGQATSSNNSAGVSIIGSVRGSASQYITMDGLSLKNAYYHAVTFGAQDTISPTMRAPGIVVQNCAISGVTNSQVQENPTCITLYSCTGALIQNNLLTGSTDQTGQNRAGGFEQWSSYGSIIQFNSIIGSASTAIGIVCKNAGNQNNTIRYNFVDLSAIGTAGSDSNPGGIMVDNDGVAGSTDYVYNNIVISSTPLGPNDMNVGSYPDWLSGFNCYNNTFVGVPGGQNLFCAHYSAPGTFQNYNNVYYCTAAASVRGLLNAMNGSTAGTGNLALSDYNCYYNLATIGAGVSAYAAPGASYPPAPTLVHTTAALGAQMPTACIGKEAHSNISNPAFVLGNPSGAAGTTPAQYQLASGSPCKGTGSTNGQTSGTATDMGAWGNGATQIGCNFTPGASTTAPLVPAAPSLSVS